MQELACVGDFCASLSHSGRQKGRKHIHYTAEFVVSKSYMKHQLIHEGRALLISALLNRPHLSTMLGWELIQTTANGGDKSSKVY